jgi:hypothetical protein
MQQITWNEIKEKINNLKFEDFDIINCNRFRRNHNLFYPSAKTKDSNGHSLA